MDLKKIRVKKTLFLIAHYTPADLSFLSDLKEHTKQLKLLGKNIVTLAGFKIENCTHRINIRDTSILAPLRPRLGEISLLYDHPLLEKLSIGKEHIRKMSVLRRENPEEFVRYALNDAIITLFHALNCELSYFKYGQKLDIPVTLSSLASQYLTRAIGGPRYDLPTANGQFDVKDLPTLHTPTGMELSGGLADWLSLFLASYKGGRNENYVFGITEGRVLDVDLKSAYPVGLSMLEYPAYKRIERINLCAGGEILARYGDRLIRSFTSVRVRFKFPDTTMYPNIPTRLDKGSIVFLKEGEGYCTGVELYFALTRLGCEATILGGVMIPFLTDKERSEELKRERERRTEAVGLEIELTRPARRNRYALQDSIDEIKDMSAAIMSKSVVASETKFQGERDEKAILTAFRSFYEGLQPTWTTISWSDKLSFESGIRLNGVCCRLFDSDTQSRRGPN